MINGEFSSCGKEKSLPEAGFRGIVWQEAAGSRVPGIKRDRGVVDFRWFSGGAISLFRRPEGFWLARERSVYPHGISFLPVCFSL